MNHISFSSQFWQKHIKTLSVALALFTLSALSVLSNAWAQTQNPSLPPPASDAPQVDGAIIKSPPKITTPSDKGMVVTPAMPKTGEDMVVEPTDNPNLRKDKIPDKPVSPKNPRPAIPEKSPGNRAQNNGAVSSPVIPNSPASQAPFSMKGLEQKQVDSVVLDKKIVGQTYSQNCTNSQNYICSEKIASFFPEQKVIVRVVGENDAMTMDFSPNRLTVHVDEQRKIKSIKIG